MKRRLIVSSCLLVLGASLVACKQGGDDAASGVSGTTTTEAALALTKGLTFEGGVEHDGLLPRATATDVSIVVPSTESLLVAPGASDISLVLEFDNPSESDNPVADLLLQFENVETYTSIPRDAKSPANTVETTFSVAGDVCDNLCNTKYELTLLHALELEDNKISKHGSRKLTLDCTEKGDAAKCAKKSSGGSGSTSSSESGKLAADLISAIIDNEHAAKCSCEAEADPVDCDPAMASADGIEQGQTCLAAAIEKNRGAADEIACSIEWVREAQACYEKAGCDASARAACIPSNGADGGGNNQGGAPPELLEACSISAALNEEFSVCFGDGSGGQVSGSGDASVPIEPTGTCPAGVYSSKVSGASTCDGTEGTIIFELSDAGDGTFTFTETLDNVMAGPTCGGNLSGTARVANSQIEVDVEMNDNGCIKHQIVHMMIDASCTTLTTDGVGTIQNCETCVDTAQGSGCMGCGTMSCTANYGPGSFSKQGAATP